MAILRFVVVVLLLGTFRLSNAEDKIKVCEHRNLTINCDEGVIKIISAFYGRNNTQDCPFGTISEFESKYGSVCASEVSLEKVKTRCENKRSCWVPAENSVFGDPCPYIRKYLEVEYFCGSVPTEAPPFTPSDTLSDNSSVPTEAPPTMPSDTLPHMSSVPTEAPPTTPSDTLADMSSMPPEAPPTMPSDTPPDCPSSIVKVDGITLTFPAASVGEQINSDELCLGGSFDSSNPLGTRLCGEDSRWENAELTNCYNTSTLEDSLNQLTLINVTEDNVYEVVVNLVVVLRDVDSITATGLDSLFKVLASVVEVETPSEQVTDSVISVVDHVMALDEETLAGVADLSDVVLLLESQVALFHQNGRNYSKSGSYLEVNAFQVDKESLAEGFTFEGHLTGNGIKNSNEADNSTRVSIRLPPSIVDIIEKVYPNISVIPLTFILYVDAILFRPIDESLTSQTPDTSLLSSYVGSQVIAANVELDDVIIKDLPQNSSVLINFPSPIIRPEVIDNNTTVEFSCVYWNYNQTIGGGKWSQEGCTSVSSTDEEIVCSCNHLTSFAVLVTVHDTPNDHLVLQVLTMVGCILSIVGLSFSVLAMLIVRTFRKKQQTHVHLNLSLALLGFYLSFLFGIDQADLTWLCRIMASLIYFFCLSSMAWMSVEAFYIYMLIWRYKRSSIRHFIPVAVIFAWGLPAISSLLVYFLFDKNDYTKSLDYCFLHLGHFFSFGFILPVFLLFLYNSVVFTLATYRVSCRKIQFANDDDKKDEVVARVKSIFLFWILLGISWLFGFLATVTVPGALNIVVQVIFCFLFAFQGVFMFFMLFLQNPELKRNVVSKVSKYSYSIHSTKGAKSTNIKKDESSQDQPIDLKSIPVSHVNDSKGDVTN